MGNFALRLIFSTLSMDTTNKDVKIFVFLLLYHRVVGWYNFFLLCHWVDNNPLDYSFWKICAVWRMQGVVCSSNKPWYLNQEVRYGITVADVPLSFQEFFHIRQTSFSFHVHFKQYIARRGWNKLSLKLRLWFWTNYSRNSTIKFDRIFRRWWCFEGNIVAKWQQAKHYKTNNPPTDFQHLHVKSV